MKKKITIYPLEERVLEFLAQRRGTSVDDVICDLIRKEAALELTGLTSSARSASKEDTETDAE